MSRLTDVEGLLPTLQEKAAEAAALQAQIAALSARLDSAESRLTALETPGPPPVLPGGADH